MKVVKVCRERQSATSKEDELREIESSLRQQVALVISELLGTVGRRRKNREADLARGRE